MTSSVSIHVGSFAQFVIDSQSDAGEEISGTAAAVMLTLRHWAPITTSALGRVVGVRQPTAHRIVERLVADRLVARAEPVGREVYLSLTRSGRRRASELQSQRSQPVEELLSVLGPRDVQALDRLLRKMLAAATPDRTTARTMCRFCDHQVCDGAACPVGSAATEAEKRLSTS